MTKQSLFLLLYLMIIQITSLSKAQGGTKYYVSPSGNDENLGTSPEKAWQTIEKINDSEFEPGDTIAFEGGQIFYGALSFSSADSGTSSLPVTVNSFGAGKATINSGNQIGLYAYNCAGFVVQDLIFIGSGRIDTQGKDGISFYNDLDGDIRLDFVRINNVDVSGYHKTGISLGGWNGLSGFKDVRISNSTTHDNGDKGINIYGYWPPPQGWANQDIYIGYCKAYNNPGIPDKSPHSGNGIMISQTEGAVIEYCEAYENGWLNSSNAGGPIGIWAWDAKDIIIQYCESHHNKTNNNKDGGGFDLDGGCINCIMQYNYSHDNHGAGYGIYQFDGAREFKDNTVRYNISENDGLIGGYGAINFWATNSSGGIQNTKVYNNTVYVSSNTTGGGIVDFAFGATFIYNTDIYNNIIVTAADKKVLDLPQTAGGWSFNGNCYWTDGSNLKFRWDSNTYTSLEAWRSATGQEKLEDVNTGFELDPQLTNAGRGGTIGDPSKLNTLSAYRLLPTSPMIDSGIDLLSTFGINPGSHDFYGTKIPQLTRFDIGAAESEEASSSSSHKSNLPNIFGLNLNYPNPFNAITIIPYSVVSPTQVAISIYDLTGERISQLTNIYHSAGDYSVSWDGRDHSGKSVGSGIYFCQMETVAYKKSIKIAFLK
jgi:hypothetical protein